MSTTELVNKRLDALRIGREARRANHDSHKAIRATLRASYADMNEWERLARDAGFQLPYFNTPLTTGGMERWLRKLGIERESYFAWDGSRRLRDFINRNPTWSLRAWVGLLLEHRDQM